MKVLSLKEYRKLLEGEAKNAPSFDSFCGEAEWVCNVASIQYPTNTQLEFIWNHAKKHKRMTDSRYKGSPVIGMGV